MNDGPKYFPCLWHHRSSHQEVESVSSPLESSLALWPALSNGILANMKQAETWNMLAYWGSIFCGSWDPEAHDCLLDDERHVVVPIAPASSLLIIDTRVWPNIQPLDSSLADCRQMRNLSSDQNNYLDKPQNHDLNKGCLFWATKVWGGLLYSKRWLIQPGSWYAYVCVGMYVYVYYCLCVSMCPPCQL